MKINGLMGRLLSGAKAGTTATSGPTDFLTERELAKASNAFSLDLFKKAKKGNAFISPQNVHQVLSMAFPGARGNTAKQMAKVLRCEGNESGLCHDYAAIVKRLGSMSESCSLAFANMLWGQEGYPFDPRFVSVAEECYGAGLRELDFADSAVAAEKINLWASDRTNGKIKNLVLPEMLGELTRLVLTGAIHFKGKWETEFEKRMTKRGEFKAPSGKVDASFMSFGENQRFCYAENDDVHFLEMPYRGKDIAMVAILPKDPAGLPDVESRLSAVKLDILSKDAMSQKVHVKFPKFKVESRFLLGGSLCDLGMDEAFSSSADFSGMTTTTNPDEHLHVSEVVQKAFVAVDEEGTEAAAATAAIMKCRCCSFEKTPEFVADHPFIFLIRHRDTGLILFMGRIEDTAGL